MIKFKFDDGAIVGKDEVPYFIAELNSSHNGNIEIAKQMIVEAKKCGCNCVKFQSWSSESLYCRSYYKKNLIAERIVKKLSLSQEQLFELSDYCKENGISFASTPYSREEVDVLLKCNVPFIKISSMDINNYNFLKYIAKTNKPIVLSTGMSDLEEIRKAVNIIKSEGNDRLALLHCISIYPTESKNIHLNNIKMLQDLFPEIIVGFSDHTLGINISIGATALGSSIIEKHFTLNASLPGMDNNMAIEPDEMLMLVKECRVMNQALGSYDRVVSEEELEQRSKMRRSVVTTRPLTKGHTINASDITLKRPGEGISADKIDEVIGKVLKNDIDSDCMIRYEDLV